MTLVVSVRVPDGVVAGADSLATLTVQSQAVASGEVVCPHCNQTHQASLNFALPPGIGTLSTLPYALKLVPLFGRYAVTTFGTSMIAERSVFSLIMQYQREHEAEAEEVERTPELLGNWIHGELGKVMNVDDVPDDRIVVGAQISAFRGGKPTTTVVKVGKKVELQEYGGFGATVNGQIGVPVHLWQLGQAQPQMSATYQAWSVLDAAEYVKFLISLTADSQRFAAMVPNVGGEIDIALVTPENNFRWIQKKALADLLLREEHSHDAG